MKTIHIIDNGCDRYTIKADCSCLGRQWDNEAEEFQVVIPEREISNTCTMIVSASGEVIDHIDIKGEPKKITNVLSRHNSVEISFSFTNETGYLKNSEIKNFYFAEARKPEDFVPVEPEQTGKIDILLAEAFIRVEQDGKIIRFFNANGDLSQEIVLAEGVTDYKDLDGKPSINGVILEGDKTTEDLGIVSKETDPTVPQHVKDITEQDIQNWDNKAEKSEIPDVSQFVTSTVDNLVNYYTKTETDNKLSAIPKFDIKPVDELPTENISNTSIYLLKVGTDSPTLYEEYIHVNNAWELLGTAKVDLTDYVKNTDYATTTKAGVMKIGYITSGLQFDTSGYLKIFCATDSDIDAKTDNYKPIVPAKLNYAVGSVKASEFQSGTAKMWTSVNEDGEIGLNISTEV